ncbi:hypothetical protein Aeh1ORF159c [Aeromonas phage Aeh1]|uniref:Uncharacterized protein n=1 Tax=Aeromonas phage Aeh1 TaxID=2880362 RepID=Q76YS1_9CAUD|nr:hypothetical protein Aeh1p170 [Aeromonas phage Aeh1]AAQ17825.1 hypothetical protein Aeh1ORF159c [Aeromonas phage Aeh1]
MKKVIAFVALMFASTANAEILTCQFQNGNYVKIGDAEIKNLYVRLAIIDGMETSFWYDKKSYKLNGVICLLER